MSGYSDADVLHEFGRTIEFIPKPFTVESFGDKLRKICGVRR